MRNLVLTLTAVLSLSSGCGNGSSPDPCEQIDCSGHGSCSEGVCQCTTGWTGEACDRCADGYHLDGDQCLPDGGPCDGVDCSQDPLGDLCSDGICICDAAGERCTTGETCSAGGCFACQPTCTGKCSGADDGCGATCPDTDCPSGCCDVGSECIDPASQDAGACGSGGSACLDCAAALETDSCDSGACTCAAAGAACGSGQACTAAGCGCAPSCETKCAGADDGCGGFCQATTCLMGCCLPDRTCLGTSGLGDSTCGIVGQDCVDCTQQGQVCVNFACVDDIANNAVFVAQGAPASAAPGEQLQVSVTMRNTGTASWSQASDYKLGAQNPQDNSTWGFNRVQLDPADLIGPGDSKTFEFQVTAPAAPGLYDFQWQMLQEQVEWFGEQSPNQVVALSSQDISVCEAARPLAGADSDASAVIQACIDAAAAGSVLEIPAGLYRVDHPVLIHASPITLRTEGIDAGQPKCALTNHSCCELRASTAFTATLGIVQVTANGTILDHLVLDGNKTARASTPSGLQCAAYQNSYGYNLRMACDNCSLSNSVTRNALCGTGCEVSGVRTGVTLWRNTVAYCGVHDVEGLWADGITVHDAIDSSFTENEIIDSTDIDLIFGGCVNCTIEQNYIRHTDAFSGGAFAALMIHAWPSTSGNFTGSVTRNNTVDCGPQQRCGIGLYLGSDAWYVTDVFGGSVHDNTIQNVEMGVLIDDVHDMQVYDNPVTNEASFTQASCGLKATYAYAMGDRSFNVDTSLDTLGTTYAPVDFDGCIPNWWNQ